MIFDCEKIVISCPKSIHTCKNCSSFVDEAPKKGAWQNLPDPFGKIQATTPDVLANMFFRSRSRKTLDDLSELS